MSAGPATITIDVGQPTIARAYDDLADGLRELATALRTGELAAVVARAPVGQLRLGAGGAASPVLSPPLHVRADPSSTRFVATMAAEVVKSGLVVLVVYQGLLTLLPAPERPRFAPPAAEASPAGITGLPSVVGAAHAAAGGQLREVDVDVHGGSGLTALP